MRHFSAIAVAGLTALGSLIQPASSEEPIKIGVMFPLTGPVAAQGAPERDAVKQAFEEENNTVAGRKIELLYEDSMGKPDLGLTKTKALVERDKVNFLLSELVSSVGAAMAPYVNEQKIPWVSTVALASLTRAQKSPYIFRFVPSSYQFGLVASKITKQMNWNKAYFIGWNAPPSREAFEVVKKIYGEENVDVSQRRHIRLCAIFDQNGCEGGRHIRRHVGFRFFAYHATIHGIRSEQANAAVRHRLVYQRRSVGKYAAGVRWRHERLHILRHTRYAREQAVCRRLQGSIQRSAWFLSVYGIHGGQDGDSGAQRDQRTGRG
jgi:hypothetical protein